MIRPAPTLLPPPPRRPTGPDWTSRLRWIGFFAGLTSVLLYLTWPVLSVLVASAVMAYLLDPLVQRLEARGLSRNMGAGVIAAGAVVVLLAGITLVVPAFVRQIQDLSVNLKPYVQNLQAQVGPAKEWLHSRYGVVLPVDLQQFATMAPSYLQKISPDVRDGLTHFLGQVAQGGMGVVLQVVQVSLIGPFTWFLLVDWPKLVAAVRGLVPPRWVPVVTDAAVEIDSRIFAFVRGQILVCALLGVLYTVGLLIAGIDLAVTVGMMSGFLFLVPYLGTVVGLVLSCTLALLKFGPDWHVLACIATFVISQGIEGTVLTPFLVGDRVGLHPMVVIIALMVGGNLLGIWGLVVAVPLTAALAVIGERTLRYYQGSSFYRGT